MFIGHFGLSFAAKKAAPKVSLGILFIATQFVDILWPFFLVLDVEKVAVVPGYTKSNAYEFLYYPYTHSLFMGVVWGIVVGGLYWLLKRETRGAIVVALCVLSHWFLDLIVHVADLQLTPFGAYKVGFGLWNNVIAELALELLIFLAGVYIYANFTKAKNKAGRWGFWGLVVLLLVLHIANSFGGTPPDSVMIVFVSATVMMAILVAMAYWVDNNREVA